VPAEDTYLKGIFLDLLIGIHLHMYFVSGEIESSTAKPEVFDSAHKLQEMWNGKRELVEKRDLELLEVRGGGPMNNRFQVSANALKHKPAKVSKCEVCGRHTRPLPLHVKVANRD